MRMDEMSVQEVYNEVKRIINEEYHGKFTEAAGTHIRQAGWRRAVCSWNSEQIKFWNQLTNNAAPGWWLD